MNSRRKALFLDRDGVINRDGGYVHRPEDVHFLPGIFELCRAAQDAGYCLIVVTNQAGIARGYYTEAEFLTFSEWMTGQFAAQGVAIEKVYYCPYHPEFGVGEYKRESADRKPGSGMLLRARDELNLDMAASVLVGDHLSDMQAARGAGVEFRALLRETSEDSPNSVDKESIPDDCRVFNSLDEIRRECFGAVPAGGKMERVRV